MGTMMRTMGTHSSGHPRRKMSAMTISSTWIWVSSQSRSMFVSMVGVPRRENTAPKKFDAATRNRMSTEISRVLMSASEKRFVVSLP